MLCDYGNSPWDAAYFELLPRSVRLDMGGGDDMSGAYIQAGAMQAKAAEKAAQLQYQMYQEAVQRLQPWTTAGQTALGQLGGIYGLQGYPAVDPGAAVRATPLYEDILQRGITARDRSALARGMSLSGPQQKALSDWGSQSALQYAWSPYISGLTGMSTTGAGTAGTSGQWGMQTGQIMGQDYMSAANANAQALINSAIAEQQSSGGFMQDLMSGLGLVGGLALAPFTGGSSLMGSGMSALSGMFGGGGYGGYSPSLVGTSSGYSTSGWGGWPLYQEGGPIEGDQPAIVGEAGPELFVPDRPGYIVPNSALSPYVRYSAFRPMARPVRNVAPLSRYIPTRNWLTDQPGALYYGASTGGL